MKYCLAILIPCLAFAAQKTLTIDDILAMRTLQAVQISPDGLRVAFVVREPNDEQHSKEPPNTTLWVVPAAGGEPQQYAASLAFASSPQWSRDSRQLAFLNRGRVYVIAAAGGEPHAVTPEQTKVGAFRWSPNGRSIAFLAPYDEPLPPEAQRRLDLGYDAYEPEPSDTPQPRKPNRVWVVDLESGRSEMLQAGGPHVLSIVWSPDGSKLLLTVADHPNKDDEQLHSRLVTVDAEGHGGPEVYCAARNLLLGADWSPDGKSIAYLGSVAEEGDFYPTGLYICRGQGSAPQNLIADTPFTVHNFRWAQDDSFLVKVTQGAHCYAAWLRPSDPKPRPVTNSDWEVTFGSDFSVSAGGQRLAVVLAKYNIPPDIWAVDADGSKHQLTHLNPELEQRVYGKGQEVHWKSQDGLDIPGVLILPVGYKPGTRYPMVVNLHGSNGGEMNEFQIGSTRWGQLLAANGYAVLVPDFRGSATNGSRFMRASKGDWGGGDMNDVLTGVDAMVQAGIADPHRLGICGFSYGGYLTARTITQTDRFKAAILVSGITNWFGIHTGQTGAPQSAQQLEWVRNPYDQPEVLWERSPSAHLKNVKSATLIIWGELDSAIPLAQPFELFRGLRHFGVSTKLVIYPRDGHIPSETNHLRDVYQRALAWFDEYVMGTAADRRP